MTNIQTELKGDKLHIIIDVSPKTKSSAQFSSSGKNRVLASTHGFAEAPGGVKVGLNVICK